MTALWQRNEQGSIRFLKHLKFRFAMEYPWMFLSLSTGAELRTWWGVVTWSTLPHSTRRQMIPLWKLPLSLLLPASVHRHIVFLFLLGWSYLLWHIIPWDHPSPDNQGNDCIGKRQRRGGQRKMEIELNSMSYSLVNVLFIFALTKT